MYTRVLALLTVALSTPAALAVAGPEVGDDAAKGSLAKDVIRGVIMHNINDVKQCYEAQVAKNPDLSGRVVVRFIVGIDGKVTESRIEESTLKNATAESCIANAVKSWAFPSPKGGKVVVTYPFLLKSE